MPSGLLLEAQTALARAIDRHAVARVGLDPAISDLLVRLALAPDNHLRGIDICRQLLTNPSRTSRLIDRAEAAGVAERQADPEDRRAQRITLTDRGRAAVDEFLPHLLGVLDRTLYSSLTTQELKTLSTLLRRVRDGARRVAEVEVLEPP